MSTKEQFDEWLKAVPQEAKEPFCPFHFFGYCDMAYTEACWECSDREDDDDEKLEEFD